MLRCIFQIKEVKPKGIDSNMQYAGTVQVIVAIYMYSSGPNTPNTLEDLMLSYK